jgi:DNA-binding SARP family transcriptional activator
MPAPQQRHHSATITTFGRLAVAGPRPDAAAKLLSQPKRFAVLIYVLLSQRGGAVSRDQLIGVFWPESDASRARNSLRQTLSFVRTCLGQDAVISIGAHGLAAAPAIACDAVQFDTLLDDGKREEALALYGGELLSGFHIPGSAAFSHWLDHRREQLAHRAAKAAWDLSAECEGAGDVRGAAFWGKRALALSPFSESEVQRLLRLLDRVGDLTGALRAFTGLEASLRSEFGVQPSAETVRLAAAIRARFEQEAAAKPAVPSTRRIARDRRLAQRRIQQMAHAKPDRRTNPDRRTGDRRTGQDRRAR